MVRYLFYTIGDLTYQSPLVIRNNRVVFYIKGHLHVCYSNLYEIYEASWQNSQTMLPYCTYSATNAFLMSSLDNAIFKSIIKI